MRHPFDLMLHDLNLGSHHTQLQPSDLEFEESISLDEAESIAGGTVLTTLAVGEEGGGFCHPHRKPKKGRSSPVLIDCPIQVTDIWEATTHALGEEGGFCPSEITTLAIGEEGGDAATI